MAAAQVAKKLKDKRQQRTIEGIFKKVCILYCMYVGGKYISFAKPTSKVNVKD